MIDSSEKCKCQFMKLRVRMFMKSAVSRLIIEKIYELYFHRDKRNCLLYTGVHIKQVSMEQGLLYSIMKNHQNKYFDHDVVL